MPLTLLLLRGDYHSTCGYCGGAPGTRSLSQSSHSYGIYPYTEISCAMYMAMIDRGWRRSGSFLYKPIMETTCCPQYTVRLEALQFAPSRSQRQAMYRWNRFILEEGQNCDRVKAGGARRDTGKEKGKEQGFDLVTAVHTAETSFAPEGASGPAHLFEVTLEPPNLTQEKFQLYQDYQHVIHKEEKPRSTKGFCDFLVDSPLWEEPIPYPTPPPPHLPKSYGSYHQCYRVDGELIAMAVLDILPRCVSSVYFMYMPRWERFSLGKVSVLREAALAREIHDAGIGSMAYLYLGFYVHSCQKMRYKRDYAPSYFLDPEEYTWFPLTGCIPLLDKHRYACFSHPENSCNEARKSVEALEDMPSEVLANIKILKSLDADTQTVHVASVTNLSACKAIIQAVKLLGPQVAQEAILCLDE